MMRITLRNCRLKDLNGICHLSQFLAQYFPRPEQFMTGIYELVLNAVEHGNLGIGFETKTALLRQGRWQEEIARRMSLQEYAQKEVAITLIHDEQECRLTIVDQGDGFAWKDYVERPAGGKKPNGRGLWVAFNSNFDRILFNPAGNEVTCVAHYCPQPAEKKRMVQTA